jgi:DNA-binding transcriptional MerR regulator/predicted enzyme related to lactoylglutathione lyase
MASERGDRHELLGIGEFSSLTGLPITALRHYHQAGLLIPGDVDRWTGYRRYRREQARTAAAIRALRSMEMSIEDVGSLLRAEEPEAREIWAAHRDRLRSRIDRFRRSVDVIDDALLGETLPTLEAIANLINKEAETMIETTTCRLMGVTLNVPDVDAAARFYRQVLGIEFEPEEHPGGPRHLHACGGTWRPQEFFLLTLWPCDDSTRRANIDFAVNDVDATWRRALEAGARSTAEPYDSGEYPRHAAFTDPFGNHVNVYAA